MMASNLSQSDQTWVPAPQVLLWEPTTVDVWRGFTTLPQAQLDACWKMLSSEEQARAQRYKFPEHRHRFIAAHGMLRCILSRYLQVKPHTLEFAPGPHGKPFLVNRAAHADPCFNLSHSQDLVLVAVSQSREVGIDVEQERQGIDYPAMISRIFTEEEARFFWALPKEKRQSAFFSCWTKKEAYLKACGDGLASSMRNITVWHPVKQLVHPVVLDDPRESARWTMRALHPAPGFAGALVASGNDWGLRCWETSIAP